MNEAAAGALILLLGLAGFVAGAVFAVGYGVMELLAGAGEPQAQLALDPVGIEGDDRHARLRDGDRERVVDDVLALEAAVAQPLGG